jgi:hypothetical protein
MSKDSENSDKPLDIPTSVVKPPVGEYVQNSDWSVGRTTIIKHKGGENFK